MGSEPTKAGLQAEPVPRMVGAGEEGTGRDGGGEGESAANVLAHGKARRGWVEAGRRGGGLRNPTGDHGGSRPYQLRHITCSRRQATYLGKLLWKRKTGRRRGGGPVPSRPVPEEVASH